MSEAKRILIVEDDPVVMEVLDEALVGAGYEVAKATEAKEALLKLKKFSPHLVVTDNDMPEWTGIEMLRELRRQEIYTTVIFVSGRTDANFIAETLKAGADDFIRKPFRVVEMLARVEVALRANDLHRDLMEANVKLAEMVEHDELTGLFNMRSMYDRIDLDIKRAERGQRHMACVMLDMDKFKSVNDDHDHLFGSFVLKEMGRLISEVMRETDYAARYGGDEFLVVLAETDPEGVKVFCERLRQVVEDHKFVNDKDEIQLTISMGYALGGQGKGFDARSLVREADKQLYRAKEAGRNQWQGTGQ